MTMTATVWTLVGLIWLSVNDPKRRRVFKKAPSAKNVDRRLVWLISLLPALILICFGTAAGFVLWFGAVTTLGWFFIAVPDQLWTKIWTQARSRLKFN